MFSKSVSAQSVVHLERQVVNRDRLQVVVLGDEPGVPGHRRGAHREGHDGQLSDVDAKDGGQRVLHRDGPGGPVQGEREREVLEAGVVERAVPGVPQAQSGYGDLGRKVELLLSNCCSHGI